MKKILSIMLLALAVCFASCEKDNSIETELSGDDIIQFEDYVFLKALIEPQKFYLVDGRLYSVYVDTNGDGQISVKEAKSVYVLGLVSTWISSMSEIKYFTSLTHFRCYENFISSLDLSENSLLYNLECSDNPRLTSLNVSECTDLNYLYCYDNPRLTSLDVSGCTALSYLYCTDNQLTSLDLSKNIALTDLYCYNNQLTSLDVSKSTALNYLHCYDNQLTSLDVSGCTALTQLRCENNQLTSLDLSKNPALAYLTCSGNQLTKIILYKNHKLSSSSINSIISEYGDIIEYVD